MEENTAFEKLFEDYFLEKFKNFNIKNCHELKIGNQTQSSEENKVTEVIKFSEKFLAPSENFGTFNTDLIEFSSDSESEDESEEDTAPKIHEDVSGSLPCDFSDSKSEIASVGKPTSSPKDNFSSLKTLVYDDNDLGFQSSWPLQIISKEGLLMCSLCQWISPNESTVYFLDHCRSPDHRTKLKERFRSNKLEILSSQTMKQRPEIDSIPNSISEKPFLVSLTNVEKNQNKDKNKNKKERQQHPQPQSSKQKKETTTKAKNLKIHALSQSMKWIQAFSEDQLMCQMCNKIIPEASEFNVLMKNVSVHLQSKTHLKNLLKTENSIKANKRNPIPTTNTDKVDRIQNNPVAQRKNDLGNNVKNSLKQENDPSVQKLQGSSKVKSYKVAANIPSKKKKSKKKPAKFLCLPCNLTYQMIDVFNKHLGLKSHLDSLNCQNQKTDLSLSNMSKCKSCDIYLFGSLYQINKHYSKCVEKKN